MPIVCRHTPWTPRLGFGCEGWGDLRDLDESVDLLLSSGVSACGTVLYKRRLSAGTGGTGPLIAATGSKVETN